MAQARPIARVNKGIYDFETKETIDLDVCFPVLHGKNGEDGAIAGMLQMFDLPCVGCDILGAAICMDKGSHAPPVRSGRHSGCRIHLH